MRREAFLQLTSMSADDLKNLTRRDLLPFNGDEPRQSGWRDFSAFETFLTVFALQLSGSAPVQIGSASFIARRVRFDIQEKSKAILATAGTDASSSDDILAGIVHVPQRSPHSSISGVWDVLPVAGTAREIGEKIAGLAGPIDSVVLGNATAAARLLKARADEAGIDLGGEFWL